MSTPRYVVKKIGDQYVPVLQDPYPRMTRAVFTWWSGLLWYMGWKRRGLVRGLLWLGGIALIAREMCGPDWRAVASTWWRTHSGGGRGSDAPSYQNDFRGRAAQLPSDLVDEQVMESFPASDAPARTGVAQP